MRHLGSIDDPLRWIGLAILIKLGIFTFFVYHINHDEHRDRVVLFLDTGDAPSYTEPAENLLRNGDYIRDYRIPNSRAGRLPGYPLTYLVFRLLLSPYGAKTGMVLLQVFLSGVSVYCLAHLAYLVFGKESIFLVTFLLYGFSTFVSQWDLHILTDGLAASFLIFSVYLLYCFRRSQSTRMLLAAGMAVAYAAFLRPYFPFLIPIFALFVWLASSPPSAGPSPWRKRLLSLLVFLGPFLFFDGAWTARNFRVFGRIIPGQIDCTAGYGDTEAELAEEAFVRAVGENWVWWKPNTFGNWFNPDPMFETASFHPPSHDFAPGYDINDLLRARELYRLSRIEKDSASRAEHDQEAGAILRRCTEIYRRQRAWDYYVVSRLRLLWMFLANSGTDSLPLRAFRDLKSDPLALFVKLASCAAYQLIVWCGLLGIVACARQQIADRLLIIAVPFCLIGGVSLLARLPENRLLATSFPFLAIGCGYLLDSVGTRWLGPQQ